MVGFLICLYRFSANVRHSLARLPAGRGRGRGACGSPPRSSFRLTAGARDWSGVASNDPSVTLIGQAVNAVVSTVLWAYLASIAILLGGELNAVLRTRRATAARRVKATAAARAERHGVRGAARRAASSLLPHEPARTSRVGERCMRRIG